MLSTPNSHQLLDMLYVGFIYKETIFSASSQLAGVHTIL